ncbi:hypothetical protein QOT17_016743 [Balamuthia mandrillaris]
MQDERDPLGMFHSLADIAPLPRYITGGSPSLSADGQLLFVAIKEGGVLALNTENGDLEWGTSVDDLADGIFSNSRQVPTTSPTDGSIITFWRETETNTLVVVGLSPATGKQVHFLQTLEGQVTQEIEAAGAVSRDGVLYLSVGNEKVAVDLASFQLLWNFTKGNPVQDQSLSIAVDGRCKENYVLNSNGECSDVCEHPNARLVGRNMCGFNCGSDVLLWHPFEDMLCTQCEANQYWSSSAW